MTYLPSLLGGVLIGISALLLYAVEGQIAGISGIVFSAMRDTKLWKLLFIGGLIGGGWLAIALGATAPQVPLPATLQGGAVIVLAGLLVGLGTRLGNGCTSGHGVCGIARMSPRSFSAVATFMGVGMLTATAIKFAFQ
jgi:uncharacterized protein